MPRLKSRRPRAAGYSFIASIELTDLDSDHKTVEKTMDLSLFGCHVVPGNSSPAGKRLRLQIAQRQRPERRAKLVRKRVHGFLGSDDRKKVSHRLSQRILAI